MGYRSDVVLAIAPEAAHAWMALLAKRPEVMSLVQGADKHFSGYEQEGDWFMQWADLKWYSSYPEVNEIIRFMEALQSEDMEDYGEVDNAEDKDGNILTWDSLFRFVRVGEEYDDIDDIGSGFFNIRITRDIIW
tara:strand:- start:853 stop:1254 length:402 start_codon:yes stop_codon:yes gene_type:complete